MKSFNIPTTDGILSAHEVGRGAPLVFLHGGPGDTHDYLREVAEQLASDFHCVLFDQRGTGGSTLNEKSASNLTVAKFIDDIDAILDFLNVEKATIFGHSWGAILGLLYNVARPGRVKCAALVSMGPLNERYGQLNAEGLMAPLTKEERESFATCRSHRSHALERGDVEQVNALDREMMLLRTKSWVVNPDLRELFLQKYFSQPSPDRFVNKAVWKSFGCHFDFAQAEKIKNPVWLCQGREDANPLEQAEELLRHLARGEFALIEQCGHVPYFEKPEEFFEKARDFLARNT